MRRFLFTFDLGLICVSAGTALALSSPHSQVTPLTIRGPAFPPGTAGFLLLFSTLVVLFARINGLYELPWKKKLRDDFRSLAKSVLSAAMLACSCIYLWHIGSTPIEPLGWAIAASWSSLAAWRLFIRSQSISGLTEKRNVLIVGCGANGAQLRRHLEQNPEIGYVFKGYIDRRNMGRPPNAARNIEEGFILGTATDLLSIARAQFIDEVFISVPSDRHLVKEVARHARSAGLNVRVVPDLYDGLAAGHSVEYVGHFPTMTVNRLAIPTMQLIVKRLLDIILSAVLLILVSPLLALIAVAIKLDSKGPILYGSLRVGKKGETFRCCKFRTMVENAEALKSQLSHLNERDTILFKIKADPRLTRVGRYLRKFSLDELPQLWNVLMRDMSLVGPRPSVPGEYGQYALEHLRRLDVAPGVTGLWQVTARTDPSFESYISLDKEYVNNWSLALDCRILLKTIGVVLAGTGE
jgi:exopolysaccharide biosynthesis polyprenyl glycosylphosphotransferase